MTVSKIRRDSPSLPRIDLPRSNTKAMFISGRCDWGPDVENVFHELLDAEGHFISGTPYLRGRKKHVITAVLWREDGTHSQLNFRLIYDASGAVDSLTVPREDRREGEFLFSMLRTTSNFEFQCNIEFVFPVVVESALWFPLPSQIGGTTDTADTFEIVGVRALKLPDENDDSGYSFTLDRHPEGEVALDLYFSQSGRFTLELPNQVLDQGHDIAGHLVGLNAVTKRSR